MQKKMKVKIQGEIEVICTPVENAPKLQHTGQNVIFAVPGKEADVLPLSMADELFATFSQQICTDELDDTGLYLEYDSRLVIPFDHEQFIIGPVLVYAMDKKRIAGSCQWRWILPLQEVPGKESPAGTGKARS